MGGDVGGGGGGRGVGEGDGGAGGGVEEVTHIGAETVLTVFVVLHPPNFA